MKKRATRQNTQLPLRLQTRRRVALSPLERQEAVRALARLLREAARTRDED
jgi:hypothetical protein